jgi:hypothetical protein
MTSKKTIIILVITLSVFFSCKNAKEDQTTHKTALIKNNNPCDNPKTVKELLACANTVGEVDEYWIQVGSILNKGACSNAWNDKDTVLNITYKDSIILWRVNEYKNTTGNYSGSWFTNYSAKAAGLTKAETLRLFALNPCPDEKGSWDTCKCVNGKQPLDSIIRYEEKVKIGGNQALSFGVVGKSAFGTGGPMQWHIIAPKKPRFRLLEQIKWD